MRKLVPLVVDALLVAVFCVIGRRSHDEAILTGLLRTLWPFVIGLALGWIVAVIVARRIQGDVMGSTRCNGTAVWPTGILVWLGTLCGGMLLRSVSGQGTAFSFMLVAAALALFLIGWRVVVTALS